jgi:hypothetical protein
MAEGKNFIIRYSMFDIQYSFRAYGKFIILELPTAKVLAKQLRRIRYHSSAKGAAQFMMRMIVKYRIHKAFKVPHLRCSLFVQSYPGLTAGPINCRSFEPKNLVFAKTMRH